MILVKHSHQHLKIILVRKEVSILIDFRKNITDNCFLLYYTLDINFHTVLVQ